MNGMTETMFPASSQHHSTRHKYHLSTIPLGRLKKFEIIYTFNSVVVPCDFGAKFYFTSPIFILHLFFLGLNVNLFFKTTRDDLNVHAMIRTSIVPHQRILSQTSSHLDLLTSFCIAVEQMWYKITGSNHRNDCIATGARINDDGTLRKTTMPTFFYRVIGFN